MYHPAVADKTENVAISLMSEDVAANDSDG